MIMRNFFLLSVRKQLFNLLYHFCHQNSNEFPTKTFPTWPPLSSTFLLIQRWIQSNWSFESFFQWVHFSFKHEKKKIFLSVRSKLDWIMRPSAKRKYNFNKLSHSMDRWKNIHFTWAKWFANWWQFEGEQLKQLQMRVMLRNCILWWFVAK